MRRRDLLHILAALPLAACAGPAVQRAAPPRGLFVDASDDDGPISPFVYGTNAGTGLRVASGQIESARAVGVRLIRWPDGNWGDEHDITPEQVNTYLTFCRQINAEPLIHARLFGGTPKQAGALVQLVNQELGGNVRYWAVGNEPDLYVSRRGAVSYTVEDYARDFREYRTAMKAADSRIVVMGPELSQYSDTHEPRDAVGTPWMQGFLQAVPDVEVISYHHYPFGHPPATPKSLLADPPSWTRTIEGLTQLIRSVGSPRPIAVTEANSDWTGQQGGTATSDSFLSALWWADVLGRLIKGRAAIVAQFCLVSPQGLGMFDLTNGELLPRPIVEVYRLYSQFGTRLVRSTSDDDMLPVVAARRDDGVLTIIVVNHDSASRQVPVRIDGLMPAGRADRWVMGEGAPVARVAQVDLDQGVTFAPRTATLLAIPVR